MRGQDPLSQVQPLSVQYRDFSVWQREQAQADEHQKQLSYWVEQLQSSRPAELLCDKPRPAALSERLAYKDATIGTPNANRDRWEVKDMVGFFVNMQCLRIKIGDESFEELVQQVHEVAVASHANADVPFENIVSKLKNDRDLSRHPLVQLVFAVHAQRDLGQLKLETIDNMLSVFRRVLETCLEQPQAAVASMPLLRDARLREAGRDGTHAGGVFASRSCEAIVAFLGILKANLAYLPFDVKTPATRMEDILSSRQATDSSWLGLARSSSTKLSNIEFVSITEALDEQSAEKPGLQMPTPHGPSATSLAYVMFTSGSTGQPKGVMVEHRGMCACTNGVPIGRALSNSGAYVMDSGLRLVPLGVVGELVVTGDGLARGYTDPARNVDRFVSVEIGGKTVRAYRTGDYVRHRPTDGQLEFFGRMDGQVRSETGWSWARSSTPSGRQVGTRAVTVLQQPDGSEARLAGCTEAAVLAKHPATAGGDAGSPAAMVPQTLAILDAMPVNQNGKVDRKALEQQIDTQKGQSGLKRQPETETQRTMQQLWAGVLAIDADSIGLDDSFFRLGGDSIAAMKLVGEARRAGIHLTVADLFRNPKLDQLAAAAIASAHASPASIPQVEHAGPVAQSFAQGRLWFLEELHPGLTWYLMPLAVRIRGPLDLVALHSALLAVERRHETLRTTFATVDGASVQVVQPFQAKDLNIIDIVPGDEQGLTEAVHQDHSTPFDLRTEPGWRVTVYRMSNDDHVLSTVMHHIISDGWSVDVLMRELAAFYSASMRGQDPLSQAQADEHQKQLSYWVEQLQSSRPAELLCDKPRPAALSGEAGVQSIEIAGPLYAKLQSFCQLHGVTQFVVLLAAFRATHFRLTGQEDATIGTPNANRDRWEVKDMVGFFVNMQCLRIKIGDESFEELVQQVHEVAVASHANADVPFENIVSKLKNDRDLSRHPLVQLVFAVHAQRDLGQLKLEGVETENLGDTVTSRFDLEFHFSQQADGLRGSVMFSTDLYAPETIDNMLSVFRRVLETCLEQPQAAVASMPLLRDADYAKLDAMGLVRVERRHIHETRVSQTVARARDAGGVFASRSCEAIVAFLGILKANLAYLPFDVKTPATRMEDILSSRPGHRLILVGAGAASSTKLSNIEFVSITEALDEQSAEKPGLQMPTTPWAFRHQPGLCHVYFRIHRSAQGSHGGASRHVRLVRDNNLVQHLPSSPVMAHMANLAFDATTLEIYACLLHGGTLVCVDSATVLNTSFLVSKEEAYANGVPIGRALSNSGAYVMDSGLRLVPLGVVGELVVTGDGLARGYTDPARNVDRFVSVEIGGKTVRAYRTGDYVRHRPTDGQLEFFGRMDGQVKIRGNRVELGEIEHTLRSDKVVREAVAVLQQHDGSEARLAGFVTVHEDAETADEHVDDSNESQHVDVWEEKFDADIYSPIDSVQAENIGRDFVGWTSMYDGSDIDTAEMNEWLDDTIATMLNGQRPGNVLEMDPALA
ncbi:hypothetical protein P3342_007363 [Pyrenophora teres f. teres]|nr:hypothetical protein P3342_007363 [Pyrenophora teres f. teres]